MKDRGVGYSKSLVERKYTIIQLLHFLARTGNPAARVLLEDTFTYSVRFI